MDTTTAAAPASPAPSPAAPVAPSPAPAKAVQAPTSTLGAAAAEVAADKPAEKAAEKPVEKTTEKPATPAPAPAIELKLPDGLAATDEKQLLETFRGIGTELGLDSAKTQGLLDRYVSLEQTRAKAAEDAFVAQDAKWSAELKADPDIGGPKWNESISHVRRALREFGGTEAANLLHAAGLGNHPVLVRAFAKIGRALADDTVSGTSQSAGGAGGERKPIHELLYTNAQSTQKES